MEKIHIERNTVQETLIIPLLARKVCTEVFGDFFTDHKAIQLMDRLDYDFGDVEKHSKNMVERFGALEVACRQKAFALEVQNYLKLHPRASVVNLGCGLDQTAESCDNGSCRIYNLDFPDIIAIRNQLLPPEERVTNVACDLNDTSWVQQIPREDGAVFFASGVFYYFTAEQIAHMVNDMAAYFHGGVLTFDTAGKTAANIGIKAWIKKSGIEGVFTSFYVGSVERDINPWLKHAKASSRKYMTGYFDLKEPSITGFHRFAAKIADNMMKMKIVKIVFDPEA